MPDKKAGAAHCKRVYTLFPIQIPKKILQNRPQLVIHPTFVIPDGPYGRLRQTQIERLRHKTDQIPGPYVPEYLHQPQRLKNPDQKFRLRHRDAVLIRFLFYPENQTMQVIPEFLEEILRHGAHPLLLPLGLLRKEECINDHFVQRIGRVPYLFSDFLVRAAIVTFPLFFNLLICLSIYCLQCRPAFILSLSMGKSTLFRIRKSGLLSPKFPGLTRQSPLFRTQKSLVSRLTQILYDRPHLQGESTSSFLSSNRYPVALSLAPGFPHPFGQPFPCRCRHQIQTVKDRQFLPPVTPGFEFIQHHNPHHFIVL